VTDHLSGHHRDTIEHIFAGGHNVEWRQVVSLLGAVGTVTEEHNGKVKVELGPETEVLHPPRGKDVDEQMLGDLRRMLTQAGLEPGGPDAVADERERNYGDSRWGKPE
jgi:hypothetical protein